MQQHSESLLKTTLEQSPWLPGNSKDTCLYWVGFYSEYLKNLKSMADQGFAEIERMSLPLLKLAENEPFLPNVPAEKPVARKTSAKKTVPKNESAEKPALPEASAEKPVQPKAPVEQSALIKTSAEKPVPQKGKNEKTVILDKPDENELNK